MKPRASKSSPHPSPAPHGNPAYPSLEERRKIVEKNKKQPEAVKKIPADLIKDLPPADEAGRRS